MLLLSTVVVWAFQVSVLRGKLDTVSLLNELDRSQKPTGAWLMQYPLIDRWPLMQVTAPFCEAQWNLDMHAAT